MINVCLVMYVEVIINLIRFIPFEILYHNDDDDLVRIIKQFLKLLDTSIIL